jgi:hypothetical protein
MKPFVYVAGPVSKDPFGCVRKAAPVFEDLLHLGCTPFLPQLSILQEMIAPLPYETWLEYDFDIIRDQADAVIRLPGESPGADREVALAHKLFLPVFQWPEDRDTFINFLACL